MLNQIEAKKGTIGVDTAVFERELFRKRLMAKGILTPKGEISPERVDELIQFGAAVGWDEEQPQKIRAKINLLLESTANGEKGDPYLGMTWGGFLVFSKRAKEAILRVANLGNNLDSWAVVDEMINYYRAALGCLRGGKEIGQMASLANEIYRIDPWTHNPVFH